MFYPSSNIYVAAGNDSELKGWPANWTQEKPFLVNNLKWKNPQIFGGVTRQGMPKPDFMMYFDADDTTSLPNPIAKSVYDLLP